MYFRQLPTHHTMGLVQTTNICYWQNFGIFRTTRLIWEGYVFGFEIIKIFGHAETFFGGRYQLGKRFCVVGKRACSPVTFAQAVVMVGKICAQSGQ